MAPNRQRADGEGRGWIVPILAGLVLGALLIGLLVGGVSLTGGEGGGSSEPAPVETQTETAGPEPAAIGGSLEPVARHAQRYWAAALREQGRDDFEPAVVRLFTDPPRSECEDEARSGGPFYCAPDDVIHLPTALLDELPEDARAYLVGHLVAHEVQDFIGITGEVNRRQLDSERVEAARLGVAYELHADCFAGVWAAAAEEEGVAAFEDVEAMLEAVSRVADTRIGPSGAQLRPEILSHAPVTSRAVWFERGRESRDPLVCDPFPNDEN